MGLDAILRSAVATASRVTGTLKADVTHEAYASQNAYGEPVYASAETRAAVVELRQRAVQTAEGKEVLSTATVTFLGDVVVTTRDRITLPGSLTSPILAVAGSMDPTTGRPYATTVYLGGGA